MYYKMNKVVETNGDSEFQYFSENKFSILHKARLEKKKHTVIILSKIAFPAFSHATYCSESYLCSIQQSTN